MTDSSPIKPGISSPPAPSPRPAASVLTQVQQTLSDRLQAATAPGTGSGSGTGAQARIPDAAEVTSTIAMKLLPAPSPRTTAAAPAQPALSGPAQSKPVLLVGARIEVQLKSLLDSGDIKVVLRAPGDPGWSQEQRVGVTDNLRSALLQTLRNAPSELTERGRIFTAEVVSVTPKVTLRLESPGAEAAANRRAWLNTQLRTHWPAARPLTTTLAEWTRTLPTTAPATQGANPAPLTEATELQQTIRQVLRQISSPRELTDPNRLQVAVQNSGIWLEALLARAATTPELSGPLEGDLKARLLRLAELLRTRNANGTEPLPPKLAAEADTARAMARESAQGRQTPLPTSLSRETDGMLKQVVSHQLQTLEADQGAQRWALELPFQSSAGLFALDADIQRDAAQRDGDEDDTWTMQLRLDLPILGPLLVQLRLKKEHLHATLIAEQVSGTNLLRNHLHELRQQLESRHIEVGSLHARTGSTKKPPPTRTQLLSERA